MLKLNIQRLLTLSLLPLLAFLVKKWSSQHKHELSAGSAAQPRLGSLDDLNSDKRDPDTTAVVLNWSRFTNVKRIASLLCSPLLDGIIAEVLVWNNSPQKISYEDFTDSTCPRSKLKIHNSPENLYFQARFLACAQASTQYCFIQDDDFLVLPEVIHALHARICQTRDPHTIHLLPPHEHLSSSLRETLVKNDVSLERSIHTGFAWLGHGAIMHRSEVVGFLGTMQALNASDAEMKMADNYYAVLRNRVPEIWFDQGIELGGGQPFTVGVEGDERNNRHIIKATKYLESITFDDPSWVEGSSFVRTVDGGSQSEALLTRAACRGARCLLVTNIELLPGSLERVTDSATNMIRLEARNRDRINVAAIQTYLEQPPSMAVDNRRETYYKSSGDAKMGDFIQLEFFEDLRLLSTFTAFEMALLVDRDTERIIRSSRVSTSSDGLTQCTHASNILCMDVKVDGEMLRECTVTWHSGDGPRCDSDAGYRTVRLEIVRPVQPPVTWRVHEAWVRGRNRPNDEL